MSKKLYSLTDEHRAQLKPWADKWIANAMSTAAMTDLDREICRDAVRRLYEAGGCVPPPVERIVFVSSPMVMRFAAGAAAWIWYQRSATDSATDSATYSATDSATYSATDIATASATDSATESAINEKWYVGDAGCAQACKEYKEEALICAQKAYHNMWQGGNQWSAYDSFLSFFRHVAKLNIDYSKWDAWETLSLHSGPRVVHKDFCIISDRPEILLVDEQNRPHCDTGPFCRWRDGVALYAVHGHYTPAWIIERPDLITVAKIDAETNAETRRIMIDKFGAARFVTEGGGTLIDNDPVHGKLWRRDRNGDSPILMLEVQNPTVEPDGTVRTFWLRVHPECRPFRARDKFLGNPQPLTALNARASTWGLTGKVFADRLQFAA